ncbi:MAG: radical SAM protein [Isosphaeraceae bacterium]|nr:radical SAM protein [Isosphaeraceae bacterium]
MLDRELSKSGAHADARSRRLKPLENKSQGTLLVHEIYTSIQGEGLHAGLPCLFIRLTACHLRCGYCDTPHAFLVGRERTVSDVLEEARASGRTLIEVTGGEPLLQPEVHPLLSGLADLGSTVLLETSGASPIDDVDPRVRIILDIKTPGSGEERAGIVENYRHLDDRDELKVVICNRADFDWTLDHIRTHRLLEKCPVLVSPAFGQVDPRALAEWVLESGLPLRLQLQLHKFLWAPNARGV